MRVIPWVWGIRILDAVIGCLDIAQSSSELGVMAAVLTPPVRLHDLTAAACTIIILTALTKILVLHWVLRRIAARR